jgi:hypothetical protein
MRGLLGYSAEKIFDLDINNMIDTDTSRFSLDKTRTIFKLQMAAFSALSVMATIGMRLPLESKLRDNTLVEKAINSTIEYNLAIPTAIAVGSVVVESIIYHHRTTNRIHELDSTASPTQ